MYNMLMGAVDTKVIDVTYGGAVNNVNWELYNKMTIETIATPKVILSVPCCQHEINSALSSEYMHPVNKFGILKERLSAILTDAIRANILQYCGYKTQVMEFVDTESSLKNLLIRATLTSQNKNEKIKQEIDELMNQLGVSQTLYNLIFKDL